MARHRKPSLIRFLLALAFWCVVIGVLLGIFYHYAQVH